MKRLAIAALSIACLRASGVTHPGEIVGTDQYTFTEPFPSESADFGLIMKYTMNGELTYTCGQGWRRVEILPGFGTNVCTNVYNEVWTLDDVLTEALRYPIVKLEMKVRGISVDGPSEWRDTSSVNICTGRYSSILGDYGFRISDLVCGDYEFKIDNYGLVEPYYSYVDYSGLGMSDHTVELLFGVGAFPPIQTLYRSELDENRINRSSSQWFRVRRFASRFRDMRLRGSATPPQEVVPVPYRALVESEWLGFDVTNVQQSTFGVRVSWRTDVPPPYRAVLRRMADIENQSSRVLGEVETSSNTAFFPGNFTDVSTFVQVGTASFVRKAERLSGSEFTSYSAWVGSLAHADGDAAIMPPDPDEFVQTGNERWSVFKRSDENRLSFDVNGNYAFGESVNAADDFTLNLRLVTTNGTVQTRADRVTVPFAYTEWTVRPVSVLESPTYVIPDAAVLVGTGYRVTVHEDDGTYDLVRAYSASPDASDRIVVPRPWKALSSHLGLKFTIDWLGTPTMQPETNSVPDTIYWKGL